MTRIQRFLTLAAALLLAVPAFAQVVDTTPPAFLAQPIVTSNTNPAAPLTGRIQITSDEPVIQPSVSPEATR